MTATTTSTSESNAVHAQRDQGDARAYSLTDRFAADSGTVFLTGIQALARLPFEQLRADRRAGRKTAAFVSGYPGSPLGGYGEAIAAGRKALPDVPVIFRQGVNEEYAATAVMGSQLVSRRPDAKYDGVVGLWYGKAPGCLLYTSPSPRDRTRSRMPSSA